MKRLQIIILTIFVLFSIFTISLYFKKLLRKSKLSIQSKSIITIVSPVFKDREVIPKKYTCDGENISPPLIIKDVSSDAKSLVLVVDDPDAPMGTWTHWLVWNINPKTGQILEDTVPDEATVGKSDFGTAKYGGPCPPSGTHRYFFKVYALDTALNLSEGSDRRALDESMKEYIIDKAELVGIYN